MTKRATSRSRTAKRGGTASRKKPSTRKKKKWIQSATRSMEKRGTVGSFTAW